MVAIILAMLVIFILTAVVAQPDLGRLAAGLVPSLPTGSSALVVGAVATTFSVVGAIYQIQFVQGKGGRAGDFRRARGETALGPIILRGPSVDGMEAAPEECRAP